MGSAGPSDANVVGCHMRSPSISRIHAGGVSNCAAVLHTAKGSTSTSLTWTLACKGDEAYKALPAKVAQWVLRLLEKNWQSYFAALAAWQADPSKFLGRPRLPGYKDKQKGRNLFVYTIQALSVSGATSGIDLPVYVGHQSQDH